MTPERFQQIRDLFEAALEQRVEGRTLWLEQTCAGDEELWGEVQRMLIADSLSGKFIEQPAVVAVATAPVPLRAREEDLPRLEGRRIGSYQIRRELGHGGMGSVYLAERADDAFQKQIAFKLLRPGLASPDLLWRFQQEREILAGLDHPHIARLLDGGTTEEGWPYFVMEYVEGQPIDQYCDAHKLNVTERLKLFRDVCAAVQYAHQNLVVHRDLKPSNILVTEQGTVKLLDFGIAKLLRTQGDETAFLTRTGIHLMTPEYASPEQVKGAPITTATDVYSLGVVLYELLTAHRPYRIRNRLLHEVVRIICEEEPTRPSIVITQVEDKADQNGAAPRTPEQVSQVREGKPAKLRKRLTGDLDTIVLMALRKEPQRRYRSVEQFSEDLRQHLDGKPVLARGDTVLYRARKFVRRHHPGVAAVVIVVLLLMSSVAVISWEARIAHLERNRAEREAKEAVFQRQRAEREADLARQHLLIAQQKTAEADAKASEAALLQKRAEHWARETHSITEKMLSLYSDPQSLPAGMRASGKAITENSKKTLERLTAEGYKGNSVYESHSRANELSKKYEESDARIWRGTPPGWMFESLNRSEFEHGLDANEAVSGSRSAFIRCMRLKTDTQARLTQSISAEAYRGKRVRLSAAIKSDSVEKAAGLILDVYGNEDEDAHNDEVWLSGDRMRERPIRASNAWSRYQIVLDVDDKSTRIAFGFYLNGSGTVWVDEFTLEVVGSHVAITNVEPRKPLNLNFEQPK